jgi:hypothetical protein
MLTVEFRRIPTRTVTSGLKRHVGVFSGAEAATHVHRILQRAPQARFRDATRAQAAQLAAQLLADSSVLAPVKAGDAIADADKPLFRLLPAPPPAPAAPDDSSEGPAAKRVAFSDAPDNDEAAAAETGGKRSFFGSLRASLRASFGKRRKPLAAAGLQDPPADHPQDQPEKQVAAPTPRPFPAALVTELRERAAAAAEGGAEPRSPPPLPPALAGWSSASPTNHQGSSQDAEHADVMARVAAVSHNAAAAAALPHLPVPALPPVDAATAASREQTLSMLLGLAELPVMDYIVGVADRVSAAARRRPPPAHRAISSAVSQRSAHCRCRSTAQVLGSLATLSPRTRAARRRGCRRSLNTCIAVRFWVWACRPSGCQPSWVRVADGVDLGGRGFPSHTVIATCDEPYVLRSADKCLRVLESFLSGLPQPVIPPFVESGVAEGGI